MSSNESSRREPERAAVNRAQRAPRERGPVDFAAYLAFLAQFPDADPELLRRRPGPSGEPFRL